MIFSDFSILMATVWCSIFMVLLFCFRSGRYILELSGMAPLLIIIAGTALRCFLPLDFPIFTRTVELEGWLSKLDTSLRAPVGDSRITPLTIIFGIWIAGILVAGTTTAISHTSHMRKVRSFLPSEDPAVLAAVKSVARELHMPVPTVCSLAQHKSPSIQGLFHPIIVIPENIYDEKDLIYVFYHELMHWKEHDLWIKLLINVLCCIFWWNPCSHLLKLNLNETLELRCDQAVSRLFKEPEKNEYVRVLRKTFAALPVRPKRRRFHFGSFSISEFAADEKQHITVKRATIAKETPYQKEFNKVIPVVTLIAMIVVFIFSYSFIIQPHYDAPEQEFRGRYEEIVSTGSYLILEPDGNYSVYVDGEKISTVNADSAEILLENDFVLLNEGN